MLKFAGILFSGDGNDIIGRALLPLLNAGVEGRPWMNCINLVRFDRRLQEIENAYHDLADLRDDYQPEAYIFIHAYDFPIPGDKPMHVGLMRAGPWMKPHINSKGITNPTSQRAIMTYMLKRLDGLMQKLEQQHQRVIYVRTQNTLTDKEWDDEMHPTTEGFKRIAAVLQDALVRTLPKLSRRENQNGAPFGG